MAKVFRIIVCRQLAQTATSFDFEALGRQYDVDLIYDNVYLTEDGYKISDYEFLSTQRCQLFATLHAMFTFHLHHSELWPQLGVTFDAFVNALGIEKSDWEAFLADEKAYYEHLQDWYTKRYERIRHPLQIEGITS